MGNKIQFEVYSARLILAAFVVTITEIPMVKIGMTEPVYLLSFLFN